MRTCHVMIQHQMIFIQRIIETKYDVNWKLGNKHIQKAIHSMCLSKSHSQNCFLSKSTMWYRVINLFRTDYHSSSIDNLISNKCLQCTCARLCNLHFVDDYNNDDVSIVNWIRNVCIMWKLCCTAEHASSVYGSDSVNTFSPSFRLDVDHLLQNVIDCDREDEVSQVSDCVAHVLYAV